MSNDTFKKKSQTLGPAIRNLRVALGETQEGMARRLGSTLSGYIQWEQGRRVPGGVWVLKLMALAPDDAAALLHEVQGPADDDLGPRDVAGPRPQRRGGDLRVVLVERHGAAVGRLTFGGALIAQPVEV